MHTVLYTKDNAAKMALPPCLGHTGMNVYLHTDEAHPQTHRSTGRIHHQPHHKQRKPHAQTPISVIDAAKLAPLRGCGALRNGKTHDGSCPQQAFDEAPSQDLWHRGTDCDSGTTVTLF